MADSVHSDGFQPVFRTTASVLNGVSNEGHSSCTMTGPSNDCKWLVNKASLTSWFHAEVHF